MLKPMDTHDINSKIKHDLKNSLLRIETIFEILLNPTDSPFSKEELSKDLQLTLKEINDYSNQLLK